MENHFGTYIGAHLLEISSKTTLQKLRGLFPALVTEKQRPDDYRSSDHHKPALRSNMF